MKRMGFIAICAACLVLSTLPTISSAAYIAVPLDENLATTHFRSTASAAEITAYDGWRSDYGGLRITWNIFWDSAEMLWSYEYRLSNEAGTGPAAKDKASHFILEVTKDPQIPVVIEFDGTLVGPEEWGPSASNPNFPVGETIWGVKFDVERDIYSFLSNKRPVWGDFYMKNGFHQASGEDAVAYNTGLGDEPTPDFSGWIPVPDSFTGSDIIPEPASMVIWGVLGAGAAAGLALRRRNRVPARSPWSQENRNAIFEIVGQGRR